MELRSEMIDLKREKNPFLPLSDVVFEILFDHLLCYVVRPGEKLYESKIADQLKISRTPVTTAFRKLEEEGFIICEKGRSARVAPFDPDDFYNIAYIRSSLERTGCVQAYCHISSQRMEYLWKCENSIREAYEKKDYYHLIQGEARFHKTLIQYSENRYVISSYHAILPKLMLYWGTMVYPSMIDNKTYAMEHEMLLGAFESKNLEIVKSTIKHHTKRPYLIARDELLKRQEYIFERISVGEPIKNIYKNI